MFQYREEECNILPLDWLGMSRVFDPGPVYTLLYILLLHSSVWDSLGCGSCVCCCRHERIVK